MSADKNYSRIAQEAIWKVTSLVNGSKHFLAGSSGSVQIMRSVIQYLRLNDRHEAILLHDMMPYIAMDPYIYLACL